MDQLRLQDDLRRYLCLRCAGFLEQVTFVVVHDYLAQHGHGPTLAFAKSWFEHAPNLGASAFIKLVGRFGSTYQTSFETFLTPVRKATLSDLLDVRNDVAHGKHFAGQKLNPDRYVRLCEEIYDWLIETFFGDSVEVLDDEGVEVVGYERTRS
ncbi:hypothetical protein [Nocardioides sp. YIM 152315]|uniref:hypothetical protein n=1 Tax=Nocardioides sp. YIM 152315 TaxID=3031760 RepID=UPI0023DBBEB6|nr:hypothetical protein [Nocardioides sp. YIM 152315]MDF1605901.1 hypothetical protein [Nocardioides sp. YIM 152315]